MTTQVLEADLTWTGERFERNIQIEIGPDGRITRTGPLNLSPTTRLTNRALLPGFVNTHSHAFQRGLRGKGEAFPAGAGSFWTWREEMYALVDRLDPDLAHTLSLQAFREMLRAGFTTVGEFHYIHHDSSEKGFALDEAVLAAAKESGIRTCFIQTHYNTGGFGRPLAGGQRRFRVNSPAEFWEQVDRLSALLDPATQTLGATAHSVRAAPIEDIVALHAEAKRRGIVFHMHVEEQRREVQECIEAHGAAPMALLNERLDIDDRFTAVHCTHTDPLDMERFIESGGNVCVCPLTEGNLGDGVFDAQGVLGSDGRIAIGTDSNARLCAVEELRWLEYVQRLESEQRGVVTDDAGFVSRALLRIGTANGARALGVDAGDIRPGALADLAALDLSAPELQGWTEDTLLDSFIFGAGNSALSGVYVGGRWIAPAQ